MTRGEKRRGTAGISVYPEGHVGSVLYGKQPRMLEDDGIASLGEAKKKGKNALKIAGRILLFPLYAVIWLGTTVFKRRRLARRDKRPVASRLVPYYKPQISFGEAEAFTAPDVSHEMDWGEPTRKKRKGLFKQKDLLDEVFNKRKMPLSTKAKITAAAAAVLLAVALGGYGIWWQVDGRYSIVSINDNGVITEVRTSDETIEEVLLASGVQLGDADILSVHPSTEVRDGLNVGIARAKTVTIRTKDGDKTVDMAQGTVHDALAKAEVIYDENDEITPSIDTDISDGLFISKVDVQVQYETKQEAIPFKTVKQDSDSYDKGKTVIKAEGANGQKSIKERIVVKDGAEASREIIGTTVDYAPEDRVELIGTYVAPPPPEPEPVVQANAGSGSSGGKTSGSSSGGKTSSGGSSKPSSGGGSSKPSGSGGSSKPSGGSSGGSSGGGEVASSGTSMTVDFITAYSHTGKKTATGAWPTRGMCAVNPKIIPYGTRLYIPGYGEAVAADTGSFTNGRNAIDVFFETEDECRQWGRKYSVTIQIL